MKEKWILFFVQTTRVSCGWSTSGLLIRREKECAMWNFTSKFDFCSAQYALHYIISLVHVLLGNITGIKVTEYFQKDAAKLVLECFKIEGVAPRPFHQISLFSRRIFSSIISYPLTSTSL